MIDIALVFNSHGTSVYEDLTQTGNVISVNASQSLGKTVGSMEIRLGATDDYKEKFGMNDSVDLYLSYSALDRTNLASGGFYTDNSSAFIFSGNLGSLNYNWEEGKEEIELVFADKTVVLTNIIGQRTYWLSSQGYTIVKKGGTSANSVIHQFISEINELMNSADTAWVDITIADADIDETTSYAAVDAALVFKTYAEMLQELAGGAYTNNIQFTYWIDATNAFHWKKLGSTKDDDVIYGTDLINKISFKREIYDTVNAAIVNAGVDLNGIGIWWYTVNYSSAADVGFRWEVLPETMFAKQFESLLYDSGEATSVSTNTLTDTSKSWGADALAGMWLINPNRGNSAEILSNSSQVLTVSGEGWKKGDYYIYDGTNTESLTPNGKFRKDMKAKAIARADAELAHTAKLRYRGDVTFEGDASRVLNQVYEVQMPYFGFTSTEPLKLRLTDINHNVSDGAWKTQLTLKEDVGTEGEN